MLSKLLIFIFGMMAVAALYFSWTYDAQYSFWIIPPAIIATIAIVMAPQIDWWYVMQRPPRTDEQIVRMLDMKMPFFHHAIPPVKKFLLHRIELFMRAFDWMPQGFETIPGDAKYIVCAYAAQLTHLKQKFVFKNWEKVIFYKHPFPSPQFPTTLHNSEIFEEDFVMIFSIEALVNGFLEPLVHFPVGLYEMGRVYSSVFKVNFTDALKPLTEDHFMKISDKNWNWVTDGIGLEMVDPDGLAVVCYFLFPDRMSEVAPEIYSKCAKEFGK